MGSQTKRDLQLK